MYTFTLVSETDYPSVCCPGYTTLYRRRVGNDEKTQPIVTKVTHTRRSDMIFSRFAIDSKSFLFEYCSLTSGWPTLPLITVDNVTDGNFCILVTNSWS